MNPWPIVRADMRRYRGTGLALILLVALAVALGIAVSAQERALRQGSARAADGFDLLVGAPGSQTQLVLTSVYLQPAAVPLADGEVLRRLAAEPGVAWVAPIGFGDSFRGMPIVGTSADFVTQGGRRSLAQGAVFADHEEAVVGADVRLALGATVKPSHGLARHDHDEDHAHEHEGAGYKVVGRLPPTGTPWDRAILVPIESVWEIHGLSDGHAAGGGEKLGAPWDGSVIPGVPAVVVKPKSVADAYMLRGKYRRDGTMALFPAEVLVDLYSTLGNVRDLMAALALSAQVLVVSAVLLALVAVLATRRREFAVLRAIGAPRGFVFLVIWAEASLVIGLGAVAGLALGWGGAAILSALLEGRSGVYLPTALGLPELTLAAALVAIGLVLSILPAWLAWRRPIAAGLRG